MLSETTEKTTKVPPHQAMGPSESEVIFDNPMRLFLITPLVEVPGIEPGSNGADLGLLRAQSTRRVLDLPALYDTAGNTVTATEKIFRRSA